MTSIRKWFINFNDNLTNLTFNSSSNFHYQIASAQSIQKSKLCLTSLMSMNSALSLSFQNIILIEQIDQALLPDFIYIYIIIYLHYVQYVGQNFMKEINQYLVNLVFITKLNPILSIFSEKKQCHWGAHISGYY